MSAAVLCALALAACHRAPEASAPPAVVVALPVHPDSGTAGGLAVRYPVEVQARYSNTMSFRIAGKIVERNVRLGDAVHKGQIVARLDPSDSQKQLASAQSSLDAADHRLVFAKQQLDRDTAQAAQNLVATNQLEQTQDNYASALAGRDQAAAQLVVARNNLDYNTLSADHDGWITSENADTGQVVSAGQAVYGLAWSGDTDVILDAAESDLGRVVPGQSATVTFPALPGRSYAAKVREIAPSADPQSRTFRVKLTLAKPADDVRLGMTGDAVLAPAAASAQAGPAGGVFTVPSTAIFHEGRNPAVWVVRPADSTLELRAVSVSLYGDRTATVTDGIKDGEQIVLAGVHTVFAGERVKPVKPLFDGEGSAQ
ncbi:efflux RND transporter periplasmic adaptor subunit [Pararobbsia silviterrae]|uniref:efflux RND transporter periplasmic adaptor subunit n=1 Tax=Pararobbsia silviterrae TaxID=1792498 RepID=UPI001F0C580A|nr:efflux RND transporter periplasmic adaptor subunit [Pararobbsia silviterrae]